MKPSIPLSYTNLHQLKLLFVQFFICHWYRYIYTYKFPTHTQQKMLHGKISFSIAVYITLLITGIVILAQNKKRAAIKRGKEGKEAEASAAEDRCNDEQFATELHTEFERDFFAHATTNNSRRSYTSTLWYLNTYDLMRRRVRRCFEAARIKDTRRRALHRTKDTSRRGTPRCVFYHGLYISSSSAITLSREFARPTISWESYSR